MGTAARTSLLLGTATITKLLGELAFCPTWRCPHRHVIIRLGHTQDTHTHTQVEPIQQLPLLHHPCLPGGHGAAHGAGGGQVPARHGHGLPM